MERDNLDTGYYIGRISHMFKQHGDEILKEQGITLSQLRILFFLERNNGQTTQKEIENFLNVAHPTVVGILSRMNRDGFISISVDGIDHRQRIVKATQKSLKLLNEFDKNRLTNEKIILNNFSDDEVKLFKEFLNRAYENLKNEIEEMKGEFDD